MFSSLRPARLVPTWRGLACPSRAGKDRGAARDPPASPAARAMAGRWRAGHNWNAGITVVSRQWSVVSCKRITTDNEQHATDLYYSMRGAETLTSTKRRWFQRVIEIPRRLITGFWAKNLSWEQINLSVASLK